MCVIGLWIGNARPWARGRQRFIVGPSLAWASTMTRSSADRLWLFSALAVALLRTMATSRAACWGMKRRSAAASSTRLPRMARVTRRALRVDPRRYLAVAETRMIRLLLQRGRALGVLPVSAIGAGGGKLTKTMTNHVFGHVHRHVLLAVVDRDRVPDEVREDDRSTRPGLDDPLLIALVHVLDAAEQAGLDERSLLDGARHLVPSFRLLAMTGADDQATARLVATGAQAHGRLAPGRLGRHARGRLALAATMGMVARVHHHPADLRPLPEMAGPAGLAQVLVLVVKVADLADRGHASNADPADLARWQPDLGVVALLGQQLGGNARRADDLAALARHELDVVDRGAQRDVGDRQGVADPGLGFGTRDDHVADLQPVGQEHVALLAIAVVEQTDPGRPVRVVLDRGQAGRHAHLVPLEVDPAVVLLLAAAAVADGEPAGVVPARATRLGLEQGLMGLAGRDFLERRPRHSSETGRSRLVAAQGHRQTP